MIGIKEEIINMMVNKDDRERIKKTKKDSRKRGERSVER